MPPELDIEYKEITDENGFAQLEDIQRESWGMPDLELIPRRLFKATKNSGAVVIGAYDKDQIIGYCWGWVGKLKKYGIFIYSHHNAVRKKYQNKGIGYHLKLEQREWAIKNGFKLINWTFDPLQARNTYLNLHKLGAVCNTYKINYWGEMHDAENKGMQTDRFYANWYVKSYHVAQHINNKYENYTKNIIEENRAIITTFTDDNLIKVESININIKDHLIFVEIPSNINKIRKENLQLAIDWRLKTREVFTEYFKRGYVSIDAIIEKSDKEETRVFHVLSDNFHK